MGYRNKLLRQSLVELGKAVLELGPMWLWSGERILSKLRDIQGIEALEACLSQGQGVIAATPHMGAWELAGLIASRRYPFTAMYRPPRIPGIEGWVRDARERAGARLVSTDRQGLKEMIRALQHGEVVGMLPDQEPHDGGGVFAPFFTVPAMTMTLLPKIARKTAAAVFFAYVERLPRGRGYRLVVQPAEPGIADEDEVVAATALNRSLEQCIAACPAQYLWAYRRFKQRPEGEAAVY